MRPTKTFVTITILVLILVGGALLLLKTYQNKAVTQLAGDTPLAVQQQSPKETTAELATYSNTQYGFTISYPKNLMVQAEQDIVLPFTNTQTKRPGVIFKHEVDKEYCDLSGLPENCTPKTVNVSLSLTPLDMPLRDIAASRINEFLKASAFGATPALKMEQGAEGEGVNYYFMPLNDRQSLMAAWRYIDENTLIAYKDVPGFIKKEDQQKLFLDIAKTLKIEDKTTVDTSKWQTYSDPQKRFTIKYPSEWEAFGQSIEEVNFSPKGKNYFLEGGPPESGVVRISISQQTKFDQNRDQTSETVQVDGRTGYVNYQSTYGQIIEEVVINFNLGGNLMSVINDTNAVALGRETTTTTTNYHRIFNAMLKTLDFAP
jgi:hypothetical protein